MGAKIREHPKGSGEWWVFIDHHGKRRAKKIGKDKRQALEIGKKIQAQLTLGDLDLDKSKPEAPSFQEYAERWLCSYVKQLRRQSTYERYLDILRRYVFPAMGKVRIDEIKRGDLRNLLLQLHERGLSRSTLSLVRDTINGPLSFALDEELIAANPTTGLLMHLHLERQDGEEIHPLTHEEVALFLESCARHYGEYYPFFLCAFRTGMRLGELLGLQWSDVDWHGRFIEVRRSYRRGCLGSTKTGKNRRVDMSDQLWETFRQLYAARKKEALGEGRGEVMGLIFHRGGQAMEQNFIRRIFKRTLVKAGLREIRMHDIRHTYASLLLSDGASPVYVKEQLGHSSIQITVDIYGHLIPSSNRDAVNGLDRQLSATQAQPAQMERAQLVEIAPEN